MIEIIQKKMEELCDQILCLPNYELKDGKMVFKNTFNKQLTQKMYYEMRKVTEVDFGDGFNFPIDFSQVPPNVTTMHFGMKFDQNIQELPKTVKLISVFSNPNLYFHLLPGHCVKIICQAKKIKIKPKNEVMQEFEDL